MVVTTVVPAAMMASMATIAGTARPFIGGARTAGGLGPTAEQRLPGDAEMMTVTVHAVVLVAAVMAVLVDGRTGQRWWWWWWRRRRFHLSPATFGRIVVVVVDALRRPRPARKLP